MTDKKTYVLDTNVLLSDPSSIYAFQEHNLIIPMAVLEELDRHKGRPDDVGRNARQVGRSLDDMRSAGGSLIKGVGLPGGGVLQIVSINSGSLERLPPELREPKVDNLIIALVKQLSSGQIPGILVSKDINVRIKCDSLGLKCEDYRKMRVTEDESAFGLTNRNKEQAFSLDLLFDDRIKLLTLVGPSGTGKTLLALGAALEQLRGLGTLPRYDKLIVTKPVQAVGKDIGFLPGTLEEKMEPWIAPIRDNLNFLMDARRNRPRRKRQGAKQDDSDDNLYLNLMQRQGLIEIEAITFIRGRSIPNAFIIIDEAQNLSMHELKTIITRVGDGTKIVLTGDIEQIDNVHVDAFTNGLTYAVERFKEYPIAGHVTLVKGERSELATLASKIL